MEFDERGAEGVMRKDIGYARRGGAAEYDGDGGGDRDGAGVVVQRKGRGTVDEGRGLTREQASMLCELVQMRMNGLYSLVAIGDGHAVRQYEMLGMCLAALDGQG